MPVLARGQDEGSHHPRSPDDAGASAWDTTRTFPWHLLVVMVTRPSSHRNGIPVVVKPLMLAEWRGERAPKSGRAIAAMTISMTPELHAPSSILDFQLFRETRVRGTTVVSSRTFRATLDVM